MLLLALATGDAFAKNPLVEAYFDRLENPQVVFELSSFGTLAKLRGIGYSDLDSSPLSNLIGWFEIPIDRLEADFKIPDGYRFYINRSASNWKLDRKELTGPLAVMEKSIESQGMENILIQDLIEAADRRYSDLRKTSRTGSLYYGFRWNTQRGERFYVELPEQAQHEIDLIFSSDLAKAETSYERKALESARRPRSFRRIASFATHSADGEITK